MKNEDLKCAFIVNVHHILDDDDSSWVLTESFLNELVTVYANKNELRLNTDVM